MSTALSTTTIYPSTICRSSNVSTSVICTSTKHLSTPAAHRPHQIHYFSCWLSIIEKQRTTFDPLYLIYFIHYFPGYFLPPQFLFVYSSYTDPLNSLFLACVCKLFSCQKTKFRSSTLSYADPLRQPLHMRSEAVYNQEPGHNHQLFAGPIKQPLINSTQILSCHLSR